jgi:hypothetical protein
MLDRSAMEKEGEGGTPCNAWDDGGVGTTIRFQDVNWHFVREEADRAAVAE